MSTFRTRSFITNETKPNSIHNVFNENFKVEIEKSRKRNENTHTRIKMDIQTEIFLPQVAFITLTISRDHISNG